MKKILFLLILISSILFTNAQVSGYMGKKFSIFLSPSIGLPNHNDDNSFYKYDPSYLYGANVEYIYKRRSSVGFKYNFMRKENYNEKNWLINPNFKEKALIQIHTFGPYLKFQFKDVPTPIGTYIKIGSDIQVLTIDDFVTKDNFGKIMETFGSFIDFTFNLAYGKNWVIGDYFLLGFEFESNLPFRSAFDYNIDYRPLTRHNLTTQLFKLRLNLGFLVF